MGYQAAVAEERLRRTAEAEAAQKLRTSQALEAELTAAEASGQRELAEASKKKDEALARLASSAGTREAAAGRLQAVESRVERKMREAELRAEETQSSLVQQHRRYECQAKEDLEHFKAAMDHRAVAAEELVAAARERRRLEGLSAKELEAGLKMSRQLMQHAFPCAQSAALREEWGLLGASG
ncbi:unnamed protein product [Effrenium voratum]|nr:unnamed protein product [Effrenium voratum]